MTQQQENTAIGTVLEIINENGLEGIGEAAAVGVTLCICTVV